MTDASYNTWIATLVPLRIEGDTTLVLQTEDELYRSTLERFYTPMVEKSIRESCGCELHVRFTTRETPLDPWEIREASLPRNSDLNGTLSQASPFSCFLL